MDKRAVRSVARAMAYDYDKLYRETPDALGAPTPALMAALTAQLTPPLRILDVGCGQGRDALPLARMGHRVVGVDLSQSGVDAMIAAARSEGLDLQGVVADIATYRPEGPFDVLLFDRTLHMLAPDTANAVLARFIDHLAPGGFVFLEDEPRNMEGFRRTLAATGADWSPLVDRRGSLYLRRP